MRFFICINITLLLGCIPLGASAQSVTLSAATAYSNSMVEPSIIGSEEGYASSYSAEGGEKKNDPAYKLYKKGYNLVLEENWAEARKIFAEVFRQYAQSEYFDDAKYWSAYAMKHIDKNKAKEEYKTFILKYPSSNYYDDAVADYSDLNKRHSLGIGVGVGDAGTNVYMIDGGQNKRLRVPGLILSTSDTLTSDKKGKTPRASKTHAYSYDYSFAPSMRQVERELRRAQQLQHHVGHSVPVPLVRMPRFTSAQGGGVPDEEKLDPQVRLKMDALYALGETKEDSVSFRTLRDVAVDRKQPRELREAAMDALSGFSKFDVLPVFLEVAKKDTDEVIQNSAIDYMGQISRNKNQSVETLSELFYVIPKHRSEQLQTVLSSIAEIGNDNAIDFLAHVAQTYEDYDLRSDAVYYLGNIGGSRARTALYEILKGK